MLYTNTVHKIFWKITLEAEDSCRLFLWESTWILVKTAASLALLLAYYLRIVGLAHSYYDRYCV